MKAKLLGLMAVAGFAGVMTAGAAPVTSDDFNRTYWDYAKWGTWTNDGAKVGQAQGYAWFSKFQDAAAATRGMYSVGALHTEANFDMAIDYGLTWDCPWHDDWRLTYDVMYLTVSANSHTVELRRYVDNFASAYFQLYVDDALQAGSSLAFASGTAESMRLARVGDTLTAYAKTPSSAQWQTVGTYNVGSLFGSFDDGANLKVLLGVNTDRDGQMQVDNFSITQIPEPASLALLAVGGLLLCRRKRG